MNQVVAMVECTSQKETDDFFKKLCETFNLLYFNEFKSDAIKVDIPDDLKNTVKITLKGREAINSYPVIEKFMKWYGA